MSAPTGGAKFAFTKLVVRDLAKQASFYRAVCGYADGSHSIRADIAGRPIEEIVLRTPEGELDLVLLTFLEGPPPTRSEVITAFDTSDLDEYQDRLIRAGGTVVQAINWVETGPSRMRVGFFADPEGNVLEVLER